MRVIFILIIIACAGLAGYWLHRVHISSEITPPVTTALPILEERKRTVHLKPEHYSTVKQFLQQDAPNGVIIIISPDDESGKICSKDQRRHRILITSIENPELKALQRWSIDVQHLSTPNTLIFNYGNLIIRANNIICDY